MKINGEFGRHRTALEFAHISLLVFYAKRKTGSTIEFDDCNEFSTTATNDDHSSDDDDDGDVDNNDGIDVDVDDNDENMAKSTHRN